MTIGVLSTVAQKNRKGQTAKSRRVNFGARILFRSALAGLVIVVAGVASAAPPDVAAGLAAVQRLKSSYRNNGASMDFERRYPAQVWIDLAAALDRQYEQATYRWGVEAVNAALDRELERMQAASRAPHRLLAMTRSLDNDRDLLRRCLVLPRVAHRLDELAATNELDPGQTKEVKSHLHAKCIVIDEQRALITSANFTEAAHARNLEAGVVITDPSIAKSLQAQFDILVERGELKPVSGAGHQFRALGVGVRSRSRSARLVGD